MGWYAAQNCERRDPGMTHRGIMRYPLWKMSNGVQTKRVKIPSSERVARGVAVFILPTVFLRIISCFDGEFCDNL